MTMKYAPLNNFVTWESNPRPINEEHVERLEKSVSNGPDGEINLHQNLIAVPRNGKLVVIGGAHRHGALQNLAKKGLIPNDTLIPYNERNIDLNDPEAIRIAVEENTVRQAMDPIDEYHAYYRMATAGKKAAEIALAFDVSESTARQRIAIGGLPVEAITLIRNGERTLTWGKALTAADAASRKKILTEIAQAPETWKDEQDIRKYLYTDTIEASNALFDSSLYLGPVLRDLFQGDRFQDREEFWEHQNQAIEVKKAELEASGWSRVLISLSPVDTWKYGTTEDKTVGIAIIQVSPNGKVEVFEGLVDHSYDAASANDVIEVEEDGNGDEMQAGTVKLPAGVLEFGRSFRTAVVQSAVAENPRKALEIVVAGLLGHAESPFRMLRPKMKGDPKLRQGEAFDKASTNLQEVTKAMSQATDASHTEAFIEGLDDTTLQALFARLVADRLSVPQNMTPGGLLSKIGLSRGNARQHWKPSSAFLGGLPVEELRNIALSLLPANKKAGLLSARRPHLVETLMSAFDEAAMHAPTMDADTAERLNTWAPSWLAFEDPQAITGGDANGFLDAFAEPVEAAA